MALQEEFVAAQGRAKSFKTAPKVEELLQLYALYKQGSAGDVTGSRPGMLDMKGRAKFDAWEKLRGMSREDAMTQYVSVVDGLAKRLA